MPVEALLYLVPLVRLALADEYLAGPRLSIDQIANRLGYAESTSFINAFRRW